MRSFICQRQSGERGGKRRGTDPLDDLLPDDVSVVSDAKINSVFTKPDDFPRPGC